MDKFEWTLFKNNQTQNLKCGKACKWWLAGETIWKRWLHKKDKNFNEPKWDKNHNCRRHYLAHKTKLKKVSQFALDFRFYVERRSKFIMMIQRAVEILKLKPGYCAPYTAVKEEMGMPETSCRKLFKSTEFQRYASHRSVHQNIFCVEVLLNV